MSLPPPNQYGIGSVTLQRAGTPHPAVTTLAFSNFTNVNAATALTRFRTAMSGTNARPFHPDNMLVGWTVTEMYVLIASATGVLTSAVNTAPLVGIRAGAGLPVNTSIVVNKTVAQVGRQYRGRMLWPPTYVLRTDVDQDGNIGATPISFLTTQASSIITSLSGSSIPAVLLHQPPQGGGATPAPTTVSGLVPRARIGTIRHRIRR